MPWSGGVFTRVDGSTGWQDDAAAGIPIQADLHDTAFNDLATDGINQTLNKNGQNAPTANLPMGGFKHTNCANGTADTDYTTLGQVKAGIDTQRATLSITNTTYSANTVGAYFRLRKSRGAAPTTNTIVQNGDELGVILFSGANGTGFDDAASIQAAVDDAPGPTNDMPGRLVFFTKENGSASLSERMRIDNAGRIGIQNSAPSAQLDLNSTGAIDEQYVTRFSNTAFGPFVVIRKSRSATVGSNTIVNNGDQLGSIRFDGANGTGYTPAAQIRALVDGAPGATNDMPGALVFATTADGTGTLTERMRIDNGGRVLVNETSATLGQFAATTSGAAFSAAFFRSSAAGDVAQPTVQIRKTDNNSTTSQIFARFEINNGTGSGQINANGANQAAFGATSDARLKENITDLPSQFAALMALRPVEFDYKDGSGHQVGFIAQEVQQIYPDLVGETKDQYLTLSGLGKNEARLVKGFQELAQKVIDLTGRVQALEAQGKP